MFIEKAYYVIDTGTVYASYNSHSQRINDLALLAPYRREAKGTKHEVALFFKNGSGGNFIITVKRPAIFRYFTGVDGQAFNVIKRGDQIYLADRQKRRINTLVTEQPDFIEQFCKYCRFCIDSAADEVPNYWIICYGDNGCFPAKYSRSQ